MTQGHTSIPCVLGTEIKVSIRVLAEQTYAGDWARPSLKCCANPAPSSRLDRLQAFAASPPRAAPGVDYFVISLLAVNLDFVRLQKAWMTVSWCEARFGGYVR
jgi:hypothetical protein